jgi:nondiscriminating aspartyl-tRNA synthetase
MIDDLVDMERTLIRETLGKVGEEVQLSGWVSVRRDHGKLVFLDVRDRSGSVQAVVLPQHAEAYAAVQAVRNETVVSIHGKVNERPANAKKEGDVTGGVEIEVLELTVVAKAAEELPIDLSQTELDLNLDTLLNNRTVALRHRKIQAIFKLYSLLLEGYDAACRTEEFVEIKTPKILSAATEGGANFFKIKYFDREAYLAQSPQFYKQAAASAFERVFEIGSVFRAEPHFTTRHVNEYVGLDGEMAFINGVEEVMMTLEKIILATLAHVGSQGKEFLDLYSQVAPPQMAIPRIRLSEALEILEKEYGKTVENEDIDGEGERMICEYVSKTYGSDFVFLTHYPIHLRPFYSMPSADGKYTETFDLLFRGVEIASGGQRIHDYQMLVDSIRRKGLEPESFKDYLDIFRYGAPAHGGWGLGSERIIQKLLGLGSIKEALLYPRDVKRLAP